MPTKLEKDEFTGKPTTGHEWDGIQELDTPLPRWWVLVFYACIAWALVYFVLYPSLPWFGGVLGWNSRVEVEERVAAAKQAQSRFTDRIKAGTLEQIRSDRELNAFAVAGGRAAFADNCAPCHGAGGAGRKGFPSLADDVWIWGGRPGDIELTIRHGVRGDDPKARTGLMPNFGADGVLKPAEIDDVAEFVLSLTNRATDRAAAERGAKHYAQHCVACHAETGAGKADLGAPPLNTRVWLYGGTKADIARQIHKPQHGVMPGWSGRLDEATIKMLVVYIHALGGAK
jgi:cytochrome c oxidase cbb3-type subunit 3